MGTPGSVIDKLGGTGMVAEELGLWESTVSGWRVRGIPAARWPQLVRLGSKRGVRGVTFEKLASLAVPDRAEVRS